MHTLSIQRGTQMVRTENKEGDDWVRACDVATVMYFGNTDCALVLNQIQYWLSKKLHYKDGCYWTYNTMAQWQQQFPWMCKKTVSRIFIKFKELGIIYTTDKYNKSITDRTLWYTIDYKRLLELIPSLATCNLHVWQGVDKLSLSTLPNCPSRQGSKCPSQEGDKMSLSYNTKNTAKTNTNIVDFSDEKPSDSNGSNKKPLAYKPVSKQVSLQDKIYPDSHKKLSEMKHEDQQVAHRKKERERLESKENLSPTELFQWLRNMMVSYGYNAPRTPTIKDLSSLKSLRRKLEDGKDPKRYIEKTISEWKMLAGEITYPNGKSKLHEIPSVYEVCALVDEIVHIFKTRGRGSKERMQGRFVFNKAEEIPANFPSRAMLVEEIRKRGTVTVTI